MIALALSCGPKVLHADEPTAARHATVQIQILLLRDPACPAHTMAWRAACIKVPGGVAGHMAAAMPVEAGV